VASLPPLITPGDLTEYGYEAAAGKIAAASARVRRVTGQQITEGTMTRTLYGLGPWLMPQRPVVAVTAVVDVNDNDVEHELKGQYLRACACGPLTVTWSFGFDPLPDGLIELVCAIAARLSGINTAMAAGVRTEQAGGESITWGADGWAGTTGLTRPEREALREYFPKYPRTVQLL
jgi:hypothetical protein